MAYRKVVVQNQTTRSIFKPQQKKQYCSQENGPGVHAEYMKPQKALSRGSFLNRKTVFPHFTQQGGVGYAQFSRGGADAACGGKTAFNALALKFLDLVAHVSSASGGSPASRGNAFPHRSAVPGRKTGDGQPFHKISQFAQARSICSSSGPIMHRVEYFLLKQARKCCASGRMSSCLSRNGGTASGITLRR